MPVEVTVSEGRLAGKQCVSCNGKKYYSYEGIPYARPPVGKLRFRDPQEPESWSGIRDATKPGHKCAQMDPYSNKAYDGSEDCLYLNVYTPVLPDNKIEKLPVIVFVHGGRFLVGHGNYYQPDYFIENDVILVTINYRLHILGFLCLHTPEVPGNAAFKDTVMALKWVKKNIAKFNGDHNNVTAMGESAGAGLVTSYVVSKMADGLVEKIIGQSGIILSDLLMVEEDPIEKAKYIASLLGKEFDNVKDLYNFLMDAPIEELLFATSAAELSRPPHIINSYFLPVVEKKHAKERYFEEYPLITMRQKRHKKLPILIGLNSHEGALFLRKKPDGNIEYITEVRHLIPRYLNLAYDSPKSVKFGKNLHQFYFGDRNINDETKVEYLDFVSDAYFNRDIVMFAEIYSSYYPNLFFYKFNYAGNMNTRAMKSIGLKGAAHGDIVQYQFYKKSKMEQCDERDRDMIRFLGEAWCNFARNGKPTWSGQKFDWQPYTPQKRLCLTIDKDLSIGEYSDWSRIKFWFDNMGERSKL